MTILLATIFGLVVWVVLWAIGIKSFDAFLLTLAIIMGAVTWHVVSAYLPGRRDADDAGS